MLSPGGYTKNKGANLGHPPITCYLLSVGLRNRMS
jgi:hypothetical protein